MKITIELSRSKETREIHLKKGSTVKEVLKKINIKPDTIIVIRKDEPIPIDEELINGERLKILEISSSG